MCLAAARAHCSEESLQEDQLQFRWCSQCLAACFYKLVGTYAATENTCNPLSRWDQARGLEKLEEVDDMLIL